MKTNIVEKKLVISEIYTPCDGEESHSSYSVNYQYEEDLRSEINGLRYEEIKSNLNKFELIGRLRTEGAEEVSVLLGHEKDAPEHKKVIREVAEIAGYAVVSEDYWADLTEGHVLFLKRK